ncbi:MAG TPA: hypothetical protein DEB17_05290 [Chlorobaculum sp.]|uniref:Uncharacterized protein n=1 Tax=Chlorobaculum tepidum (strain ATCC 49652 / DSM 12025 / NBRC 103806 / TLS) TaxID=194439 RepID=Q8KAT7_CHLTE|nr:hypothetical protein CT2068 [Chlorobaculum tepidum TLS]HBU23399.1 hypothetical protein [Chlorobaculum sp.]
MFGLSIEPEWFFMPQHACYNLELGRVCEQVVFDELVA